jgi:hypothetical protein
MIECFMSSSNRAIPIAHIALAYCATANLLIIQGNCYNTASRKGVQVYPTLTTNTMLYQGLRQGCEV